MKLSDCRGEKESKYVENRYCDVTFDMFNEKFEKQINAKNYEEFSGISEYCSGYFESFRKGKKTQVLNIRFLEKSISLKNQTHKFLKKTMLNHDFKKPLSNMADNIKVLITIH